MGDTNNLDPYLKALGQSPVQRPENWDRKAIMTWKAVAEPEHVAKLDVQYDMLSVATMSQFHSVNPVLIRTLLTKTPSQAPSDWQAYKATIRDVYIANIAFEPVESKAKENVGEMFMKKIEWFLTDHLDAHYTRPMPMLTPTVILELNAMMQTIEPAVVEVSNIDRKTANRRKTDVLSQFARWFDPYAEYFYQNHKNTETPKDLTAHMLRTISTNAGDIFNQPGNAAREVSNTILR